jgi:hypothetical protein
MKYIFIIVVAAIAGYFFYKQRAIRESNGDQAKDTYVCNKCGETFCECHKEEV